MLISDRIASTLAMIRARYLPDISLVLWVLKISQQWCFKLRSWLENSWCLQNPLWCGKAYIGQTGCSTETRIKEHHWHIRLYHPKKSATAEHSADVGHYIQFQDNGILPIKTGHMECIIRDRKEIELHPSNMNREEVSPWAWKPQLQTLKEWKEASLL